MKDLIAIIPFFDFFGRKFIVENHRKQIKKLAQQGVDTITVECGFNNNFRLKKDEAIRLNTNSILWQKEKIINTIAKKLTGTYKNIAFIDSGILLEDGWAEKSANYLCHFDIVQPFSYGFWLDKIGRTERINDGYVWWHQNNEDFMPCNHPATGIAFVVDSKFFVQNELYDRGIVGGGDRIFANAILENLILQDRILQNKNFNTVNYIDEWNKKIRNNNYAVTYVDGCFVHLYHGNMQNRQYINRHKILLENNYNPQNDVVEKGGVLEWSVGNQKVCKQVRNFFLRRTK